MPRKLRHQAVVVLVAGALSVSACGSDRKVTSSDTSTSATTTNDASPTNTDDASPTATELCRTTTGSARC